MSWPDVFTAYHTTGIPDIEVYFEVGPIERTAALYGRYSGWTLQMPWVKQSMKFQISLLPDGPSEDVREAHSRIIAVEVKNPGGTRIHSRLKTQEAYSFTVLSTLAIAKQIVSGNYRPGFRTPAAVYGPQLLTEQLGVYPTDL